MATTDRLNVMLGFSERCGMSVSLHRAIFSGSFHVPGRVYTGGHAIKNGIIDQIQFGLRDGSRR